MMTALRTVLLGLALGGFLADAGLAQLNYQKVQPRGDVTVNVTILNGVTPAALNWNQTYESEWKDSDGVTHRVTTPRRVGESKGNHAWRHGAYVKSAKNGMSLAVVQTSGAGTSGTLPEGNTPAMFSSSWSDKDGIRHEVNTDPENEGEDPTIVALRHQERVAALKVVFPPYVQ
jgi:hypothetical protein